MQILYEDNHIIAINKPSGLLVQGDKTGDTTLLAEVKSYIKNKYQKRGNVFLGLVHRLDRPVSGTILFAKTSKALIRLNQMFRAETKEIIKTYWAIVQNTPPKESDTIMHYLWKDRKKNKSYANKSFCKGSKKSILSYKILDRSSKHYFLEIVPHSGRHHQIRCQLSKIGCPIIGDLKYGFKHANPDKGISLHAYSMDFIHPVRKLPIKIIANCKNDTFWKLFSSCKIKWRNFKIM